MSQAWMPMYWGDYLIDTMGLTWEERGCYDLLIAHYSTTHKPLQDDEVFVICGAKNKRERKICEKILQKFFKKNASQWIHKRIEFEIKKIESKNEKQRENGKKGGRPKTHGLFLGYEKQNPNETQKKADPQLQLYVSNETSPLPPIGGGEVDFFELFWKEYPKKVAKTATKRHWERRKLDKLSGAILDAVKRYKTTETWQKESGQFIPNPLTFLNQGRWDDEIKPGTEKVQGGAEKHPRWKKVLAASLLENALTREHSSGADWNYQPSALPGQQGGGVFVHKQTGEQVDERFLHEVKQSDA